MSIFDKAQARVQCDGDLQGGILSPKLFNEYLSDLLHHLDKTNGIKLENLEVTHLLYLDDIVLIFDSPTGLQKHIYVRKPGGDFSVFTA